MSRGFFLVLEGPEGAGKTTLAAALAERFRAAGQEPLRVREPGGTPAAEALSERCCSVRRGLDPEQELLYIVTARADLVVRVIGPALAARPRRTERSVRPFHDGLSGRRARASARQGRWVNQCPRPARASRPI